MHIVPIVIYSKEIIISKTVKKLFEQFFGVTKFEKKLPLKKANILQHTISFLN